MNGYTTMYLVLTAIVCHAGWLAHLLTDAQEAAKALPAEALSGSLIRQARWLLRRRWLRVALSYLGAVVGWAYLWDEHILSVLTAVGAGWLSSDLFTMAARRFSQMIAGSGGTP